MQSAQERGSELYSDLLGTLKRIKETQSISTTSESSFIIAMWY